MLKVRSKGKEAPIGMTISSFPFFVSPVVLDLLASADPLWWEAFARADALPGLLGRANPPGWKTLETAFGRPSNEWNPDDWQRAARVLGFVLEQLEVRRILEAAPKRRGPKSKPKPAPNGAWQPRGLLDFPPKKIKGRPVHWTEEKLRSVAAVADRIAYQLTQEGRRATDAAVLERLLDEQFKEEKRSKPKLSKIAHHQANRGRLRNALIRCKNFRSQ